MRHDYCEKDGYSVTYTDKDVCFENMSTAEALVVGNDGKVLLNNFDEKTLQYLMKWYHQIYRTILSFRSQDRLEEAV